LCFIFFFFNKIKIKFLQEILEINNLFCLDEKDYVDQIIFVFNTYNKIQPVIQENSSKWVEKFSNEQFNDNFITISKDQKFLI